ncbi:type II secretion system F family protein [Aeoliella mucimassa]|uniref:Type II secretion system protein F n=1 Tax=Aeoliella mucimassa TaxID=2527972 RepID=A0A518ANA8_9BACT|nr:type II secretion system F family protein [Aeoliella mucimassa]QDU56215.1 Type II secretion system protein F [Aeoliella mucimassa]
MPSYFPTIERIKHTLWPQFVSRAQHRTLLRLIATATEQRLPLAPLVQALALDERGRHKLRLHRLAKVLDEGASLPDALEQVVDLLDDEDVLAVRFGYQSGAVSAAVRERLEAEPFMTPRAKVGIGRIIFYLGVMLLLAVPVAVFMHSSIIPVLMQIFDEFNQKHPSATDFLAFSADTVVNLWWLILLVLIPAIWVMVSDRRRRALRHKLGGSFFRLLRQWRTAATLDELSVASEAGRPLPGVISTLARYHYDPYLRHKLLYVRNEMEQGADLWPSLLNCQLLNATEARALETADNLGNRNWVLRQIADIRKHFARQKLERLVAAGVLLVVFALGAFVLLHALGIFLTLSSLLETLS